MNGRELSGPAENRRGSGPGPLSGGATAQAEDRKASGDGRAGGRLGPEQGAAKAIEELADEYVVAGVG